MFYAFLTMPLNHNPLGQGVTEFSEISPTNLWMDPTGLKLQSPLICAGQDFMSFVGPTVKLIMCHQQDLHSLCSLYFNLIFQDGYWATNQLGLTKGLKSQPICSPMYRCLCLAWCWEDHEHPYWIRSKIQPSAIAQFKAGPQFSSVFIPLVGPTYKPTEDPVSK